MVPLPSKRSLFCRLLAAWFNNGGLQAASEVFLSLREQTRTSLTSSSIFLESMVGNIALTCSSTLFLKAKLRQTRLSMNIPGIVASREEEKKIAQHTN